MTAGTRTTIYLAGPAVDVLDHVKAEYRDRYGIGTTVSFQRCSSAFSARESIDEVIEARIEPLIPIGSDHDACTTLTAAKERGIGAA